MSDNILYKIKNQNINGTIIKEFISNKINIAKQNRIERNTYHLLKKYNKKTSKNKNNPLRIGFIVQEVGSWDKQFNIYDELTHKNNCETIIIVVPKYNFSSKTLENNFNHNYFLENYSCAIKCFDDNGQTIDIQSLNLDYVFYPTPYSHYLPEKLQANYAVRYTRCCYIPYGFSGSDIFNTGNTQNEFFRNMYFIFTESEYMKRVFIDIYHKFYQKNYKHIEYLGYPALAPFRQLLNQNNKSKISTVLWAPRWSYDKKIGGSNFFEYKDTFFKLNDTYTNVDFIFRPHPLMFNEFIAKNLMSPEDVENFTQNLSDNHIKYDSNTMFLEIAKKTDLLITDYSSIIVQFFLTGKPIIYCENGVIKFNEIYQEIKKYLYIAHNEDELKFFVQGIYKGNDYLKEERLKFIEREFSQCLDSAQKIADKIINDYFI